MIGVNVAGVHTVNRYPEAEYEQAIERRRRLTRIVSIACWSIDPTRSGAYKSPIFQYGVTLTSWWPSWASFPPSF